MYRLLYLQVEIRQRFAFHINRRHLTCRMSVGRTTAHNKRCSAIYEHLIMCIVFERKKRYSLKLFTEFI